MGIFVSGSRGGYLSVIVASVAMTALYLIRTYRFEPGSLKPGIVGAAAIAGVAVLFALILFWRKLHNIVLGGGMEQYSDEAAKSSGRWGSRRSWPTRSPDTAMRWARTWSDYQTPGGMPSIDSFLLAVLTETGVPGAIFFFGGILLSALIGMKRYVTDPSWRGALMGGLGCALLAYFTYRFVLAQRENVLIMYLFIACVMFLNYYFMEGEAQEAPQRQPPVEGRGARRKEYMGRFNA